MNKKDRCNPSTISESDPVDISEILEGNQLSHIIKKARYIESMEQWLSDILSEYHGHFRIITIESNCLKIATNSSALATQIRYNERQIIEALAQASGNRYIKKLTCTVKP